MPHADSAGVPILPGCHPDPTIERVGDDFYLATSTFEYFPGIPVFHSRDLRDWTPLGHAVDRPGQLDLTGVPSSGGLFAPTLRHHRGRWFLVCTLVHGSGRDGDFVLTADDPAGPWSDPVWLDAPGIDPSLFFDDDGRAWFTGTELVERDWPGQTVVWMREFDPVGLRLVGPRHDLWHGALTGAVWAEGPHIHRRGDWYYLLASEGGTEYFHALSVARSRAVTGPYEGHRGNPVLTHRNLGRGYPIQNVGHADLVRHGDDDWAAVLLATRPRGGADPLGREAFLVDVDWEDDWPVFLPGRGRLDAMPTPGTGPGFPSPGEWTQVRTAVTGFWQADAAAGTLRIAPTGTGLGGPGTPAFVGIRQRHHGFTLRGDLPPGAGIAARLRDDVLLVAERSEDRLVVMMTDGGPARELARVVLGPEVTGVSLGSDAETFSITVDGREGPLAAVPAGLLSPARAGGFVGVWVGFTAHGDEPVTVRGIAYTGHPGG